MLWTNLPIEIHLWLSLWRYRAFRPFSLLNHNYNRVFIIILTSLCNLIVYWSIEVPRIVFSSLTIVYGHLLELLKYPLISITLELNFDIKEIKFTYTMYGLKWSSQFRDLESIIKKDKRCAFKVFLKKKADGYKKNIRSDTLGLKGLMENLSRFLIL